MPQLLAAEIRGYLSCVLFSCSAVCLGEAWNRTQRVAWLRCAGESPLYGFSQCRRTPFIALNSRLVGNRRSWVKHRHCPGFDVAGLVAATRVSLPLTNTFMEFSVSPDSSVYS